MCRVLTFHKVCSARRLLYDYIVRNSYYPIFTLQNRVKFINASVSCGPRIAEMNKRPRRFSFKLHSETQVSSSLDIAGGYSSRLAQNTISGE